MLTKAFVCKVTGDKFEKSKLNITANDATILTNVSYEIITSETNIYQKAYLNIKSGSMINIV